MNVNYNTYSCAISGMSREMMKMDGRYSVDCQNWEKRDKIGIFEIVKLEKDKNENSSHLLQLNKREKRAGTGE